MRKRTAGGRDSTDEDRQCERGLEPTGGVESPDSSRAGFTTSREGGTSAVDPGGDEGVLSESC